MKIAVLLIALSTFSFAGTFVRAEDNQNDDHNDLQLETSTYLDCDGLVAEMENGEANVSGHLVGKVIHANKKTGVYIVRFHDTDHNQTFRSVCYQIVAN